MRRRLGLGLVPVVSWLGTWFFQTLPTEGMFSPRMEVKTCSLFSAVAGDKVLDILGKKVQNHHLFSFLPFLFLELQRTSVLGCAE